MNGNAARRASPILSVALLLGACGHNGLTGNSDDDSGINAYPTNYKADILAAMHVYLNDPTGIRDAAVSAPVLKQAAGETRYVACVKFNPKKNNTDYAGSRELAAVFLVGRFDHFIDLPKDQRTRRKTCAPGRPMPRSRSCKSCRRDVAAKVLKVNGVLALKWAGARCWSVKSWNTKSWNPKSWNANPWTVRDCR